MAVYLEILRNEFEAGEGSFLIQARVNLRWDQEAFQRLTTAMETCCRDMAEVEVLERWLALGFWYTSTSVTTWSADENFRRRNPGVDYEAACRRLDDLAYWFFFGYSVYD